MRLRTPGVYSIPSECCKVYIGQRGCSIYMRLKKHHWPIQLEYLVRSAMTEHSISLEHWLQLLNTSILSTKPMYMIISSGRQLRLSSTITHRENGFCLRKSWKSFISSLKDHRKLPSQGFLVRFSTWTLNPKPFIPFPASSCFCSSYPQPYAYNPHTQLLS